MKKIIIMLLTMVFFLSACQPTPEQAPVVNKNNGVLEKALNETEDPAESKAAFTPYEAPRHWSETVFNEKLTIKIDTDIKLPDVSAYPVIKVEPAVYTQQQVDNLVNYFAAGKKLYKPHVKTKADYAAEIVEAKRGQYIDFEYVVTKESKEWVKELEAKMAAAPDESPKIYIDTTLNYSTDHETGKEDTTGGKNFLNAIVENGDGKDGSIGFRNYFSGFSNSTGFNYNANQNVNYMSEDNYKSMMEDGTEEECGWVGYGALYNKVTMTEEEALSKAQKVLSDLNIKDIAIVNVSKAVSKDFPDKGGYMLEYMRKDGEISGYRIMRGGRSKMKNRLSIRLRFH